MSENGTLANGHHRAPSRSKRPRSAITSGRQLFVGGNPNSAWTRRYSDLRSGYIADVSAGRGPDALSYAQLSEIDCVASIKTELERLDAMRSRGEEVDMNSYASASGHLRRHLESLYGVTLERKSLEINGPTLGELIRQDQIAERQRLAREHDQQIEETAS